MTREEQAEAGQRLAEVIFDAIAKNGGSDESTVFLALGGIVGVFAKASDSPNGAISYVARVASGIVDDNLLVRQ